MLAAPVLLAAALLLACTADEASPPLTATGPALAVETPAAGGASALAPAAAPPPLPARVLAEEAVDAARGFAHIGALAGEIGPRVVATAGERAAADYIAGQLRAAGYEATIELFEVELPGDRSALLMPGEAALSARAMAGSPDGTATGRLEFAALGRNADFKGSDVLGAVALLDRGEVSFASKALAAEAAGAAAVIVVNNEPGALAGQLGNAVTGIPVVTVPLDARDALLALAGSSIAVTVRADARPAFGQSRNVFARPSAAPCRAYLGAHYDSVEVGRGANDNASGAALILELARARRIDGLCIVAFGAEEIGLDGSQHFVANHAVRGALFMLNFDVVGSVSSARFIGDRALAARATAAAAAAGVDIPAGDFPPNASSDHVSFTEAGIPAITVTGGDDDDIHTSADTLANVAVGDFSVMLGAAAAVLDALTPDLLSRP